MKNILCLLGLHSWSIQTKYLPSIQADIVTDVYTKIQCVRCGKVELDSHLKWDGEDMIEMNKNKEDLKNV